MKNTNQKQFPENHSSNQPISSSKRKILTSLGVSSGVLGASALSQHWVKPVVNSVILPAHAQMTTTPAPGTDAPGTDAPGTDAPATPAVVLSPPALGVVAGGSSQSIDIKLAREPSGPVTVTLPSGVAPSADSSATTVVFSTSNWDDAVLLTVTAVAVVTPEVETKLEFVAAGGGYDGVTEELTYTSGSFANAAPTDGKVTKSGRTVTVTWTAPATNRKVEEYVVDAGGNTDAMVLPGTATEAVFSGLKDGGYAFTIVARYTKGGASSGDAADSSSLSTEPETITIP